MKVNPSYLVTLCRRAVQEYACERISSRKPYWVIVSLIPFDDIVYEWIFLACVDIRLQLMNFDIGRRTDGRTDSTKYESFCHNISITYGLRNQTRFLKSVHGYSFYCCCHIHISKYTERKNRHFLA